jgi:GT2 family glycosyltransferase
MAKSKLYISVFVPTGSRAESLRRVLTSLSQQTYKYFEVIIVDYKSKDDSFAVIEQFSKKIKIKLIKQQQKGLSLAANMALKKSEGDIFIRTDDDVEMTPGWLEAINATFISDRKIGGVTGPTIVPKKYARNRDLFVFEKKFKQGLFWKLIGKFYFNFLMDGQPYRVSHWFDSGVFSIGTNFTLSLKEPIQEVTNLEACNFSVRTKLLRGVGGFDPIYSGVGEYHEADASFKIKEIGYKLIFNPKARLFHCPSQDGFFHDRPASYPRMCNFIYFYLRHIKLDSPRKFVKMIGYIFFQDCYYIYQGIILRQYRLFGAIPASVTGFYLYYKKRNRRAK